MMNEDMEIYDEKQTLIEHLAELRKRLIYSFIALIALTLFSYRFSETIVRDMINKASTMEFVFIAPTELFMSYIRVAVIGGVVLALPIILFNIWLFIKPGLTIGERKTVLKSLFVGGILFILGSLFGYLVVLPLTIDFFASFQIDGIRAMISFKSYLSFATSFVLAFGTVFEVPILMTIVVKFGLISTETLKKNKKIAVLIIFILAAILTPPDVVSQVLLAIPMILLFEIGIFFAKMVENKKTS